MKLKSAINPDLQLMAMMVEKLLRQVHHIDEAPNSSDYELLESEPRFNGSTDIRVAIALGRGSSFGVKQHWRRDDNRDLEWILTAATKMAGNIALVHKMREDIVAMIAEVQAAAVREIGKAKRRGLPYRLLSITPFPNREDLAHGVSATVVFERLSESLRLEQATISADRADEVVEAFELSRDEQERRVKRRALLDAAGATGRIDSVVVNAMQKAGYDMPEVLRLLATTDDWIVDVGERGGDQKTFRLHWNSGDVFAQVTLGDGSAWHEGRLTFQNAPVAPGETKGRRLRDVVDNDIFGEILIKSGSGDKGGSGSLNCTQDLLNFNAETGRLWAA